MQTQTSLTEADVIEMSWRIAGDLFLNDGLAQQGLVLYGGTGEEFTIYQRHHLSETQFRALVFDGANSCQPAVAVSICKIQLVFEPTEHGIKLMDDHDVVAIVVASASGSRHIEMAKIFQSGNDVTFGECREWPTSQLFLADEIIAINAPTIH